MDIKVDIANEVAREMFRESYGGKKKANRVVCLPVTKENTSIYEKHSVIRKCFKCKCEVWFHDSNDDLIEKKAKMICPVCVQKWINKNPKKVPELVKEINGAFFN